jgi:hypothetical protein
LIPDGGIGDRQGAAVSRPPTSQNGDLEIAAPCFCATSACTDRPSQNQPKNPAHLSTFYRYKKISATSAVGAL